MKTAAAIIDALGGSASISRVTGFPLTTIESWKAANFIPEWRHGALLDLARKIPVKLSTTDFPPKSARVRQGAEKAA